MLRKWIWIIGLLAALVAVSGTSAREVRQGDICTLEGDEIIEGNLFVLCRTLIMNGTVNGNLLGMALNAEINGTVTDDVYLLAGQLDVHGTLGEDLIFAGPVLRVFPETRFEDDSGDVITASVSTAIFDGVSLPGDLLSASYQVLLYGDLKNELNFWGATLVIGGLTEGEINASVGDSQNGDASQVETLLIPFRFLNFDVNLMDPGLWVTEDGRVEGTLRYSAESPGRFEGELAADAIYTPILSAPDLTQIDLSDENSSLWISSYAGEVVQEIITLGLIGFIALLAVPRQLLAPLNNIRQRPLSSLGIGILTFIISFALWIVILLLFVLVIFVFLALQLSDMIVVGVMGIGAVNVGAASIFYFLAIYVSRIVVCLGAGRLIVRLALGDDGSPRVLYVSLLVGVVLLGLVAWLPYIGSVITAFTLALGLGALTLTITRAEFREPPRANLQPAPAPVTILPNRSDSSRQIPPPPRIDDDDRPVGPGMKNLPDGFDWWDEDERQ